MPIYAYRCDACEHDFDVRKPMAESSTPEECPLCGGDTRKVFLPVGTIFKGDGWESKNTRVSRQMREKNRRLGAKQEERVKDGGVPGGKLVPNVGGERVDSWGEAKKLAASQGKDTSGYEQMERKEKSLTSKTGTTS